MGVNNSDNVDLRRRKIKLGLLDCEIIDIIPNDRVGAQKIQRQGSSNQIVLPHNWEMHFPQEGEVCKILVKVKVPAIGRIANVEYSGMLVLESPDFPVTKLVK